MLIKFTTESERRSELQFMTLIRGPIAEKEGAKLFEVGPEELL